MREIENEAQAEIDNESRELLAVHHTGFIVAEAGQIYRGYTNSDHGIDGEIELKDDQGRASGKRLVGADVRACCPSRFIPRASCLVVIAALAGITNPRAVWDSDRQKRANCRPNTPGSILSAQLL